MIKILQRVRTTTLLLLFLEVTIVASGIILYYYDVAGLQTVFSFSMMIVLLLIIMVLNITFMLSSLASLLNNRQEKDLKTSDLLGSDIPEAYRIAGLGIVIIDDDLQIIWVNEVVEDMNDKLIETNILKWKAELEPLTNFSQEEVMINLSGKTFSVQFLKQSKMFILKDVTAYENLLAVYKLEATVVGVIVLDNYEENAPAFDEQSDYISLIRTKVVSYFHDIGFVIQKIRSDSYYLIGNMQALENFKKDNFKILEVIYNLDKGQLKLMTLSIGMAYGVNDDVRKLNAMAFEALEIAVARGGNQGIIDDHHKKESFGGFHLNQDNEMKVDLRIQERNDNIIKAIKAAKTVYIVGHKDTDMDALGASLAVKAMCDHLKKPSKVILDYADTEKRTRAAVSSLFSVEENKFNFIASAKAISLIDPKDLLIVVDVNNPDLVVGNNILFKRIPTLVIDHHKRSDLSITDTALEPMIDTTASSATELVIDVLMNNRYIKRSEFTMHQHFATIMLSGIYLDTNFFRISTVGPRSFEASRFLIEKGAETNKAHDLLKEDFQELLIINRITAAAETLDNGVLLASFAEDDPIVDSVMISKISNAMMDMRGVNAAFVIGKTSSEGKIKVSSRSDGTINVALIMEKLGGGGHFSMAAYESTDYKTITDMKAKIKEIMKEYITRARDMKNSGKGE
jgi:c-di-AMP phosphodiesterase-like protein